ncbi:MAG: hypothetical protein MZU95_04145 [Desulfomicrobium escambiense]|nr:hypothetical protein [Desulfomicrobium escambiense]
MAARKNNRQADQLREIKLARDFTKYADGSVLVEFGDTKIITTAIIEDRVPQLFLWIRVKAREAPNIPYCRGRLKK